MYDIDKVIYIGGGNDGGSHKPTAAAEIIDLLENPPRWRATGSMKFRRPANREKNREFLQNPASRGEFSAQTAS
jgi:hypothetical protein